MKSGKPVKQTRKKIMLPLFFLLAVLIPANARSFDDIFPGLGQIYRNEVFSPGGAIRSIRGGSPLLFSPSVSSGIDLPSRIMAKNYSYLTESLLVVPYTENRLNLVDAYNVLGKIRGLKGLLYYSDTRKANIPLFEDATRLDSARRTTPIPDPPPALFVPARETIYMRLRDANFGNIYYQADISQSSYGILFDLSNFKTITYLFIPVMREGNFTALLYLEPLTEGMLVYSIAGTEVSNFIAGRIDMPSAISKRLAVLINWITEGLRNSG